MTRKLILLIMTTGLFVGTACRQGDLRGDAGEPDDEGPPTVAVTHWTDRSELFMEYPVLVAGRAGRFAIHVTDLRDFKPVRAGEAVVVLAPSDGGTALEFRGGLSRPGIFGADVTIGEPGAYLMSLRVEAPGLEDLHELGEVTVHEPGAEPRTEEDEAEAITFLKEQQWVLEFGTEPVQARPLRSSLTVPGEVRPRGGGEAVISATVSGRLDPSIAARSTGDRVARGALLTRIIPGSEDLRDAASLRAALVEAEQRYELARSNRDRVARLLETRAVPERRLAEAEAALATAEASLAAERARLDRFEVLGEGASPSGSGLFEISAPFAGVITESRLAPGTSVEEGEALLRLVDVDRVDVVGAVPESRASSRPSVKEAELLLADSRVVPLSGPPIPAGHVDRESRTIETRFPLDNRGTRLAIGQAVRVRLLLGESESLPALPESAGVDDGGRPVVFVQTGGESFQRRPVTLGSREGGYVHVLEGAGPGERVVSTGAYLVRLAAMSSQIPAHGHVH